ncbi:hypothetical protein IL306_002499 [Fusarium sp. DS 682]|nr:hypothetical protein IL306_002499 [Fusarium sp. DS 682]
MTQSNLKADIEDQRFSSSWELRILDEVYDADQDVTLHTCGWRRCSGQTKVPFFHAECLSLKLHDISDALIKSGKYTFDCYKYDQLRRASRIQRLLTPRLRDNLGIELPDEILTVIAGLLVRQCAAITSQEQSFETEASEESVDLLRHVYVTYTTVEGVRYVKSISNSKAKECQNALASKEGQDFRRIWIAEDYRGIRFIKFCSANGLKLRDITVSEENSDVTVEHVSWTSPEHPNHIIDLEGLENRNDYPQGVRMIPFDCNTDIVTGYTVVTDGESVAWIHAHGPHDNTEFYAEMEAGYPYGSFIYMPLDNGEFITEICRRFSFDHNWDPSACLLVRCSKSRNILARVF